MIASLLASPTVTVAAIDIGSSAVRLGKAVVNEFGRLEHATVERHALRLGEDVFHHGFVSEEKRTALVEILQRFVANSRDAHALRAIATSAMRDTQNRGQLVAEVRRRTGLRIAVISGIVEARLAARAMRRTVGPVAEGALTLDLGGGSLDLRPGRGVPVTLPLGTLRLAKAYPDTLGPSRGERLEPLRQHIRAVLEQAVLDPMPGRLGLGTGGSLEALTRNAPRPYGPIPGIDPQALTPFATALTPLTLEDRIKKYGIKPDRADVAPLATVVIDEVCRYFELSHLLIPGTGLREILWRDLAESLPWFGSVEIVAGTKVLDVQTSKTLRVLKALFDLTRPWHQRWDVGLRNVIARLRVEPQSPFGPRFAAAGLVARKDVTFWTALHDAARTSRGKPTLTVDAGAFVLRVPCGASVCAQLEATLGLQCEPSRP